MTRRRGLIFTAPSILAMLAGRKDVTRRLSERAPCAKGDLVWAREGYRFGAQWDRWSPSDAGSDVVRYEADGAFSCGLAAPPPWWVNGRLRWGQHLPFALSRPELHRRCVSVRREPLGEVTSEDAIREGVTRDEGIAFPGLYRLHPGLHFLSARLAYFDALEALHGHPIPLDTLVWRVELGRLE